MRHVEIRSPQNWQFFLGRRGVIVARRHAIPFVRAYLSAAYGLKGEIERVAAELEDARKLWPAGSFENLAVVRKRSQKTFGDTPVFNLFDSTYFAELRKAGPPDE